MTRGTTTPASPDRPVTDALAPPETEELRATAERLLAAGADPAGPG